MSTPGNGPQYDPYGQPGSYRAGQQPGQYTSSPLPGQGYQQPSPSQGQQPYPAPGQQSYPAPGQQAYPAPGPPYAGYDPYGGSAQPGFGKEPEPAPARPGLMVLAFVLMLLVALPFLVVGVGGLVLPINAADIPPQLLTDPQMVKAGATPELLIQAARLLAGVMLVVAVVYLVLAIFAFRGRNWARIIVAVLSVGFALLLLTAVVGGATAGGAIGLLVALLVFLIGSVVILFLPDSQRWFSAPRR